MIQKEPRIKEWEKKLKILLGITQKSFIDQAVKCYPRDLINLGLCKKNQNAEQQVLLNNQNETQCNHNIS